MRQDKLKNPRRYWLGKIPQKAIEASAKSRKGKKQSPELIKKRMEARKGYKHSIETKRKMSIAAKGEKNHNWLGGKSFKPYTIDWTETLKRSIRERDKYTCQICGKEPSVYCHHIDYDKKNCNPNNLITLCCSCHSKTNINRDYWTKYFLFVSDQSQK